jgi:hypothetical protein
MTSLTQTVASLNDALVPSLSFQLPKASSYIVARQSQQIFPIGAGEYKPAGGTNLIRINLATNGWWDPLTMRLRFRLTNNCNWAGGDGNPDLNASKLSLIGPPGVLFQRIRCLCNGVVLQDSGIYNAREYYMFYNLMQDPLRVAQNQLEAPWSSYSGPGGNTYTDWSLAGAEGPNPNFRYYCIPLPCGIFNQPLFWHGTSAPITLELQLQTDAKASFMPQVFTQTGQTIPNQPDITISEVSVVGDVVTLSSDFQNNFDNLLLSGNTIPIPYKGMYTQYQVIVPGTSSVQIIAQRAFSRVSCIFAHFTGQPPPNAIIPARFRPYGTQAQSTVNPNALKEANYFACPVGSNPSLFGDLMEAQLHIGGLVIPSLPQRGLSTQFMYLRQCVHQEFAGTTNIATLDEYGTSSFVLGFQLEKASRDSSFSGLSLMAGQTCTLTLNNVTIPSDTNTPGMVQNGAAALTGVFLTFMYDCVLDISGAGASVQM